MFDLSSLIIYSAVTAVCWLVYKLYIWPYHLSPIRNLSGPPSDSLIFGNYKTFFAEEAGEPYVRWVKKYGSCFKYYGLLNRPALVVSDPKLIQEIVVSKAYDYSKCKPLRGDFIRLVGDGLVTAEGDYHKKQRRLMNPAFTYNIIKDMVPGFIQVGLTLKGVIGDKVAKGGTRKVLGTVMSEAALDVIGLVGFDHKFNSLTTPSEMAKSYMSLTQDFSMLGFILSMVGYYFSSIRAIPLNENKKFMKALRTVERESQMVMDNKYKADKESELNKTDLLSLLIKMNKLLPDEEKMSNYTLRSQIMTFALAGHVTTAVTLSWSLLMLAEHPHVQDSLRKELVKAFPDKSKFNPTFDEINGLEYLNCFIKETLRKYPPVIVIQRENVKDTTLGGHFLKKGTQIDIPLIAFHRSHAIWGPTVDDFDPSRWLDPSSIKNVTNYNYMPFGTGVRACIGSKLSLCELKILLGMLVRNFVFRPVEGLHFTKSTGLFTKPNRKVELMVSNVEV